MEGCSEHVTTEKLHQQLPRYITESVNSAMTAIITTFVLTSAITLISLSHVILIKESTA